MNEKSKEKKIEISVENLIAFRELLSKPDFTNRDSVDIKEMSIYDYDRAMYDAVTQDYSNYWIKIHCAFHAMCLNSGVPTSLDEETFESRLDLESLL